MMTVAAISLVSLVAVLFLGMAVMPIVTEMQPRGRKQRGDLVLVHSVEPVTAAPDHVTAA